VSFFLPICPSLRLLHVPFPTSFILLFILTFNNPHWALWPVDSEFDYWNLRIYFCTFGRTPWTVDRPVARSLLHKTAQHRKTRTDIHASSGIRTHDPSDRADKDGKCLRLRSHWDRPSYLLTSIISYLVILILLLYLSISFLFLSLYLSYFTSLFCL
jgi:hypothetical protein